TAQLTVTLSSVFAQAVTVDYAVTGGTATGGGVDYTLNNGTLTFAPGQSTAVIPVSLVDDALYENNETVQLTLSNPTGATLGLNRVHTLTILDNDPPPSVSFDLSSSSGDESVSPNLSVSLSAPSGKP